MDFTALKTAIQNAVKLNGNEEITGDILQGVLLSIVSTLGDSAINDLVTAISNEVAARQNADGTLQQNITNEAEARAAADTALQGLIDGITNNIENGYVYAGIATPSSTPVTGKVFYLALTSGTYTNFGSTVVSQGINILKYNGSAWSLDAFIGIDDTPTPNSPKLVKSGGIYEYTMYPLKGVAAPTTIPESGNFCYLAGTKGTYTNFSNRVLEDGEIAILKCWQGTWYKERIGTYAKSDIYKTAKDLKNEGYVMCGVATPNSSPNPAVDSSTNVAYLVGTPGVYVNFGNLALSNGEFAVLKRYNGTWYKEEIDIESLLLPMTYNVTGGQGTKVFNIALDAGKSYILTNNGNGNITTIKSVVSDSYSSETIQLFQDGDIARLAPGESIVLNVTTSAKYLAMWCSNNLSFTLYRKDGIYDLINSLSNRVAAIENGEGTIVEMNRDAVGAVRSATNRMPASYNKNNFNQCFAFVVGTDFHSDGVRFNRMCDFADKVDEITGTFVLGDILQLSNYTNLINNVLNYNKPVIPLIGNHEVMSYGQVVGWDSSECMQNFYSSELVSHNGETHPNGKCYWYKDFSKTIDNVTKKIRVIGLFSFESDSEHNDITYYKQAQIDWLVDLLDNTDSNTMVAILTHYAVTPNMTKVVCPWTPSDFLGIEHEGGSNTYSNPGNMSDNEFIPKIIQAWIEGTNVNATCIMQNDSSVISINHTFANAHNKQFIGYISGHSHYDFISKLTNYPKQIQFTFDCGSAADIQQASDLGKKLSGKNQDSFAVIGIDWFNKRINVIKIGADVTVDMRDRKYMNIELT